MTQLIGSRLAATLLCVLLILAGLPFVTGHESIGSGRLALALYHGTREMALNETRERYLMGPLRMLNICPNAIKETGEECDDANFLDGDGCSTTCTIEAGYSCTLIGLTSHCDAACGDGLVLATENCDDGNKRNFDGCTNICNVEAGYTCIGGTPTGPADECDDACGDAINVGGTECDDGNLVNGDGCDSTCHFELGWTCEGGSKWDPDTCFEKCGDGIRFGTQQCDDGNSVGLDGCSSLCTVEDGYLCTGGSSTTPDVCTEVCGDGINVLGNPCDDWNQGDGDGCDQNCNDEIGWVCSGGSAARFDLCDETCGDYRNFQPDVIYKCDDGNLYINDGCDHICIVEKGYVCTGGTPDTHDTCTEICGDARNIGILPCDDGNTLPGDGCSDLCQVEAGWLCSGGSWTSEDYCLEICGDGRNHKKFWCDDGNLNNGDGCDDNCDIEPGWYCYGGNATHPDFCYRIFPHISNVEISQNNTIVFLTFNQSMNMLTSWDESQWLITITGPRQFYDFSWFLRNEQVYKLDGDWFTILEIELDLADVQFFGEAGIEQVHIEFLANFSLISEADSWPSFTTNATLIPNAQESEYMCGMDKVTEAAFWSLVALILLNAFLWFFGVSLMYSWTLFLALQIVTTIPLMKNYIPSCVTRYIKYVCGLSVGMNYGMWTNFFGIMYDHAQVLVFPVPDYRYTKMSIYTGSFIEGAMRVFNVWFYFFLTLVFFHISKLFWFWWPPAKAFWEEIEHLFRWQILFKGFMICYFPVFFFSMLNFQYFNFSTGLAALSTGGALVYFTIFNGFPIYHSLKAIYLRRKHEIHEELTFKYELMFDDFDQVMLLRYFFFWQFALKRILITLAILYLPISGMWQLNFIMFTSACSALWIGFSKPFNGALLNAHWVFDELATMATTGSFYSFLTPFKADKPFFSYGRSIIMIISVWIWIHLLILTL